MTQLFKTIVSRAGALSTKMAHVPARTNEFARRSTKPLKHLFDGSAWNVYEKATLNLGVGAPGPDLLQNCSNIFTKASEHRIKEQCPSELFMFQYGATVGSDEVRTEFAKYLSEAYKSPVCSDDIVVTSGASQGMQLIISTLLDLNGYIFIDEVTYLIALDVFKQIPTIKLVPVKIGSNGVDVADLERLLQKYKQASPNKMFWAMYYTIPTYHNPLGILFSEDTCKSLVTLARKYDILISCDDVYNVLNYKTDVPPKRLFAYDNMEDADYKGNIISNGSFSKIVCPGLRLGWIEAPPRCQREFDINASLRSGGCANQYTSNIMASMLQLGLAQSHIKTLASAYKERMLAVCEVLKVSLPSSCSFTEPEGGYFVWLRLPEIMDGNELLKYCMEKYQIFFLVGDRFSVSGEFKNCLRLSIAFHAKSKLTKGVEELCKAIGEFQKL